MAQLAFTADPQIQHHRWLILVAVCLFSFMSTLDASIVNIALPVMERSLHIPMNQVEWVVSIYLLVTCAFLLLFGKMSDSYGKIRIFKWGAALFTLGSFLCGVNLGLSFLLFSRVTQGIGAAMTMSTNSGIITEIFPKTERGRALGTIGSFVSLGSIAGPGIAGLILANYSWGYIFWMNVPIGIIALMYGHFILPHDVTFSDDAIDWLGAGLFFITIATTFGGIFGGQAIGFTQPIILWGLALGPCFFLSFLLTEYRCPHPLVALRLFANAQFSVSLLSAFLVFVANLFFSVIMPFFLENTRHLPANVAGYLFMTFPLVQVVIAPLSGLVTDHVGPELITVIGLALISLSQLGYLNTTVGLPFAFLVLFIATGGLGNGIFQAPNNTIVMSAIPVTELGIAGSLSALVRELGMVIGIATATTVLFSSMSHQAGHLVSTYPFGHPDLFIHALHTAFTLALVLCLLATGLSIYRWMVTPRNASVK